MNLEHIISSNIDSLNSFINSFPGLVVWKDTNLIYKLVNRVGADLLGLKKNDDCIGKTDHDFKYPAKDIIDVFIKMDRTTVATGKPFKMIEFIEYNNCSKVFITTGNVIRSKRNTIVGIAIYALDITNSNLINVLSPLIKKDNKLFLSNKSKQFTYIIEENITAQNLSKRETECLFYILRGRTAKETAKALNLSYRTVETHVESIKEKLNSSTKSQLIEKAISINLINYIPSLLF